MDLLGSLAIAFSMYSRIPMPRTEWTKRRMRYAMCFFPLIGLVIGGLQALLLTALRRLGAGDACTGLLGACLPLAVTGGIHMDGFLDTTDALRSYGDREKKLAILKDPHTGAFAIIGAGAYLLVYAAACSELSGRAAGLFGACFVLERALSGWSVACFPKAKKDGLAAEFSRAAEKRALCACMILYAALSCGWLLWFGAWEGLGCIGVALLTFLSYYRTAVREFGGMTGDLAGWFLQRCERNTAAFLAFCCLAGLERV
ncbi:adenosylcobinamide-GDP ribazoletransferase [Clostridiaceae bacterium]|nr:adenosylcobinamide-GDP ribazoletransferase [Clostridium sp.]NBI72552.1 adenosylcobinamide-GDP ribazoletransferase [Clostridiaceae bacterium]